MGHGPLQGQTAIVTGASRGIGRAIALRLAEAGARVCVNYHTAAQAAHEVAEEACRRAGDAFAVGADVTREEEVESLVRAVLDRWGRVDVLVNNAGIIRDKLLLRMTTEDWDTVLDTNLRSTYLVTRCVLPHMVRQRYGRILNITSVIGLTGNAGQTNYAASKAGVIGFTRALAREVASRNITVNAVAPGFVGTDIVAHVSDERLQEIVDHIPMGRLGSPDDIAGVVLFFCTRDATYITGQVLRVDGGLMI